VFALLFLVATTSVALAVTRLGLVLAAVGATGSTTVTFIVPGAAYLALAGGRRGALRALAGMQLLIGLVLVPTCIALLITG
jgi:amino acid permease